MFANRKEGESDRQRWHETELDHGKISCASMKMHGRMCMGVGVYELTRVHACVIFPSSSKCVFVCVC